MQTFAVAGWSIVVRAGTRPYTRRSAEEGTGMELADEFGEQTGIMGGCPGRFVVFEHVVEGVFVAEAVEVVWEWPRDARRRSSPRKRK